MQALWEEHKARWPEEQRPPADRSGDEPGSWRGDAGHYLNTEENLVADHAMRRISDAEGKVSPQMEAIKSGVAGSELAGWQYRLKDPDRFKEKVADELRAKPDRSLRGVADDMPDAVRYTYSFVGDRFVSGYWDVTQSLRRHGFELDFARNSWASSQYKGVNTRWRTMEGQLFEVQFHTTESFQTKQLTHQAYERIRSPATSDQERDELYEFQAEVSSRIPVPDGAQSIPDYRRRED